MIAVLDDDPTGAQAEEHVPLVVDWTPAILGRVAARRPRALHLLTNSRALEPAAAYRVVRGAAEAVGDALADAELVLRGDSTLRAHVREEYEAVRDATTGQDAALLLVPALPQAGRITRRGTHLIERDGEYRPLHGTEYARDGGFSYGSARLVEWADERSAGLLPAARGTEIHASALRAGGAEAVAAALAGAAAVAPAVVAPDASDDADLELIAAGLRQARAAGVPVIVRCAPAFVGVLAGTTARGLATAPRAREAVLVVCGSHVPTTTRQLRVLEERHPGAGVEVDAGALASGAADAAIDGAVRQARERLRGGGLAVVSTSRIVDDVATGLAAGRRVATGLAQILARLCTDADVVVSKGGITSAVNLREGLGATAAEVVGPLAPGISLWRVDRPERPSLPYVVFPGNVGTDAALADVVDRLVPV